MKMVRCYVTKCRNNGVHSIPKDPEIREQWLKAIRRENFKGSSRLCRDHFVTDDYYDVSYYTGLKLGRNFLKKGAVPSQFSWTTKETSEPPISLMSVMQTENVKARKTYVNNHKNDSLRLPDNDQSTGPAVSTLRITKIESCNYERNSDTEREINHQSTISNNECNISDSTSMSYSNNKTNQAEIDFLLTEHPNNLKETNSTEKQSKKKLQQFIKILTHTQFCGVCIGICDVYYSINNYIVFDKMDDQTKICIKDMLKTLLKNPVSSLLPKTYICQLCLKKLISSYMFVKNIEHKAQQFNDYIQQINENINKTETSLSDENMKNYDHTVIILHENDNADNKINNKYIGNEKKAVQSTYPRNGRKKMSTNCTDCKSSNCEHIKYINHFKKQAESNNPTTCLSCNFPIKNIPSLLTHVNELHLNKTRCENSGKKFFDEPKLKEHKKTHEEKTQYSEISEKYVCGASGFKQHRRSDTGKEPYRCIFREDKFTNSTVKKLNIAKKHSQKSIKCPLCNRLFRFLIEMRAHFKRSHWSGDSKEFDINNVPGVKKSDYELYLDKINGTN